MMMKLRGLLLLFFCFSAGADMVPIREVFSPPNSNYPSTQYMKVSVLQWANEIDTPITTDIQIAENYKQTNRETIATYIREASKNGASLFVTPEFAVVGYPDQPETNDNFNGSAQATPYAELPNGKTFQYFSLLAKELKMYLHIGFLEKDRPGQHFYNSLMVIDPMGNLKLTYRKQNLFWGEDHYLTAGTFPMTYFNPAGKMGLGICADIYVSDVMDPYHEFKLDALIVAASWSIHNAAYNSFIRAAKWVNAPVIAANHTYFPDSGVVNADGTTQSHIRQTTGLAYGFLPLKK